MHKKINSTSHQTRHTIATFQALVDAMIPRTPQLAQKFGRIQEIGALDLHVDQYMIWVLDHMLTIQGDFSLRRVMLSEPTAELLDAGAVQLVAAGGAKQADDELNFPGGGAFSRLSRSDRFRAMYLLESLNIDLGYLPPPYQYNAGLVQFVVDTLNRLVMFGFYSEWPGYGTTRLAPPGMRRLEVFPVAWLQTGYPGPSLGYRQLRGFLLKFPHRKRDAHDA
ncbi:hypothetical protein [Ammoniphilus sp. 3BR4]|uniref:hypothetical protein n=1 Tax=Ammoniphilus sp. 3BR4 TaxID=3158265 RepID=UPI003465D4B4